MFIQIYLQRKKQVQDVGSLTEIHPAAGARHEEKPSGSMESVSTATHLLPFSQQNMFWAQV